jgi:hypothetical protein
MQPDAPHTHENMPAPAAQGYRGAVALASPRAATLWLPLRRPRHAWGAALLVSLLYALAMARDLSFYDSGELALAALQLGLSHPPGQPLFTLLGFAFSKLTPGAPLLGLNFLSALAGGLALLPALSLAERMLDPESEASEASSWLVPLVLVLGSQHAALWEQATRVEVYALAVLLALWCLARGAYLLDAEWRAPRAWLGLGLGFGLCAAVNPVLCAFAVLGGAPGLVLALRRRALGLAQLACAGLGCALGLLLYAYVPLVAGRQDALVWGAPATLPALVDYLGGRDFRTNLSVPASVWLRQMAHWVAFSLEFALLPLWGIGLVAHGFAPPRGLTRALAPLSCLLAVAYLARYARFIPEVPDYVSYTSLASWLCLAGCGALLAWLWARRMRLGALALLAVLVTTLALAPPGPLARTRFRERTARSIASALLASAPPRSVLVAGADHWVAPLWYLQEIEQQRPDVVVLASGLLSSSWYFEHLFRRHPGLQRVPLRGPGGQLGRLGRLLAKNAERAVLFEDPELARALGLSTCVQRFFAAARSRCSEAASERLQAAALWERVRAELADGEPTALGVLADISYRRGLLLAAAGDLPAALRTLLVPLGKPLADVRLERPPATAPQRVAEPPWRRPVPLGDPARNLYVAAQLSLAAGSPRQALIWMLAARERGLPEADAWLAALRAAGGSLP